MFKQHLTSNKKGIHFYMQCKRMITFTFHSVYIQQYWQKIWKLYNVVMKWWKKENFWNTNKVHVNCPSNQVYI